MIGALARLVVLVALGALLGLAGAASAEAASTVTVDVFGVEYEGDDGVNNVVVTDEAAPAAFHTRVRFAEATRKLLTEGHDTFVELGPHPVLLPAIAQVFEEAAAEPSLPFFLEWGDGTPLPGSAPITHPAGEVQIASLELDGDAERLERWLGSHSLPFSVRPGGPALARVILSGAGGELTLA